MGDFRTPYQWRYKNSLSQRAIKLKCRSPQQVQQRSWHYHLKPCTITRGIPSKEPYIQNICYFASSPSKQGSHLMINDPCFSQLHPTIINPSCECEMAFGSTSASLLSLSVTSGACQTKQDECWGFEELQQRHRLHWREVSLWSPRTLLANQTPYSCQIYLRSKICIYWF